MANPNPNWQHGTVDYADLKFEQRNPSAFRMVEVIPGESLGDLTRRVMGTNTKVARDLIYEANDGQIFGTVKVPK
jgi:hypothetical protein